MTRCRAATTSRPLPPRPGAPAAGRPESRAGRGQLAAAVIAGAYQTGVLGVRALKRRGVRAFCVDCNPANPGSIQSTGPLVSVPGPGRRWRRLGPVHGRFRRPARRAAGADPEFRSLSHRDRQPPEALADHYILSPGVTVQGLLADKHTQYDARRPARHADAADGVRARRRRRRPVRARCHVPVPAEAEALPRVAALREGSPALRQEDRHRQVAGRAPGDLRAGGADRSATSSSRRSSKGPIPASASICPATTRRADGSPTR